MPPLRTDRLFTWRMVVDILAALSAFAFLWHLIWEKDVSGRSGVPQFSNKKTHPTTLFGNSSSDNESIDGLTSDQCGSEFPNLYHDIERAVHYWRSRGEIITPSNLGIQKARAAIRLIIHNNEIRILESKNSVDRVLASPDRALGTLRMINRALMGATAIGERLPSIEATLSFQDDVDFVDDDDRSYWAFDRDVTRDSHRRLWLMPNFDFWYYGMTGSFADAKRAAMRHDAPFVNKIPKAVWRGSPHFGPDLRRSLLEVTKDKAWADVVPVMHTEDPPIAIPSEDFCKYAMTIYTEGVTYSGRLKFLLNCQSLLFVHDTNYATHYSHLLEKDGSQQNHVAVRRDWSDLEDKVQSYLTRPQEAERIIANSVATFRSRYNTRAALSCYIRRLIESYATVMTPPRVEIARENGLGSDLRGWSFEKFMDKPEDGLFE